MPAYKNLNKTVKNKRITRFFHLKQIELKNVKLRLLATCPSPPKKK